MIKFRYARNPGIRVKSLAASSWGSKFTILTLVSRTVLPYKSTYLIATTYSRVLIVGISLVSAEVFENEPEPTYK